MQRTARVLPAALVAVLSACGSESRAARAEPVADSAPAAAPEPAPQPERIVAVTFDDLPVSRDRAYGLERMREVTGRLLDQLREADVPAIGFVNEEKLEQGDDRAARVALLERWLDAGMELGNHTYAHPSFQDVSLEEYQRQVLRGERVTRRIMAERGQRPRFFRHTYLNTGPDRESKEAFERFLAEHGYRVAPVTIDNMDVMYALAYDNAYARGDSALMRRIGDAYVEHMRESFDFFEGLSRRLLDREPAQVLMLHANALNADYMDELVAMLRARGYGFVPLETALEDPAYDLPDDYVGERGLSWLHRWAITRGMDSGQEPRGDEWVREVAYP